MLWYKIIMMMIILNRNPILKTHLVLLSLVSPQTLGGYPQKASATVSGLSPIISEHFPGVNPPRLVGDIGCDRNIVLLETNFQTKSP